MFADYNIYQSQRAVAMSNLTLANVEALASSGEGDSNTATGYKLTKCYDGKGNLKVLSIVLMISANIAANGGNVLLGDISKLTMDAYSGIIP